MLEEYFKTWILWHFSDNTAADAAYFLLPLLLSTLQSTLTASPHLCSAGCCLLVTPMLVQSIDWFLRRTQYMGSANAMGGPQNLAMNIFCYALVFAIIRAHPRVALKVNPLAWMYPNVSLLLSGPCNRSCFPVKRHGDPRRSPVL